MLFGSDFNLKHVSVHVCCTVTTDDQAAATFTATPEQYTSAFADAKRAAEAEGNRVQPSAFPLIGYIPDSHRFQNVKKPTPFSKRYCGFTGFLTGVSSALECEKMVDRFRIEVDTVAFLGAAAPSSGPKSTPASSQASGSGSAPKKGRWSFNPSDKSLGKRRRDDSEDGGPTSSPSPVVSK
ncbi:hypothetical protein DFH06DRAFT_1148086 [Mycena polygramma]|nr:hypothetical protein DFH06DRAFT_1148086 [Mycena polygramma]